MDASAAKPIDDASPVDRLAVKQGVSAGLGDRPAAEPIEGAAAGDVDTLSAREVEVLRLIALGYTSAEVARKLRLSPRTVETHRGRINRKLGASKRSDLVRYALRRGLLGV